MEKSTEPAEELGVNHLTRSLPLEVPVVQTVVAVQPGGYSHVQQMGECLIKKERGLHPKKTKYPNMWLIKELMLTCVRTWQDRRALRSRPHGERS